MSWMPWMMVGFYALMFGGFFVMRILRGPPQGRRRFRPIPMVIGALIATGMIFFVRNKDGGGFQDFHTDGSTLTLSHLWPKAKETVAFGAIDSIAVVRGRHFYKGKRSADHAWIKVKSGAATYVSCETATIATMTQAAHSLATTTGKPLAWQERCPDPDNNAVPATEEQVNAAGQMEIPAACAPTSAKPPASAKP